MKPLQEVHLVYAQTSYHIFVGFSLDSDLVGVGDFLYSIFQAYTDVCLTNNKRKIPLKYNNFKSQINTMLPDNDTKILMTSKQHLLLDDDTVTIKIQ